MDRQERREANSGMWWLVKWMIIIVVISGLLGIALEAAGYAVLPTFLGFKREALQSSREYQVGVITELNTAMTQYNDAEVERAKAETNNNKALVTAQIAAQKNALKSMQTAFNKVGGVSALQKQTEFRPYVQFFNDHSAELR
ncbi:hypothetical protein BH09PAT2_BH09PAT2_04690 [soil metagenome]